MIEFETLAMKADIDKLYNIPVEAEYETEYYSDNIGVSTHSSTRDTQEVEGGNYIS